MYSGAPDLGRLAYDAQHHLAGVLCSGIDGARQRPHCAGHDLHTSPTKNCFFVQGLWTPVIFCLRLVMDTWAVLELAAIPGKYLEMWYVARENSSIVFEPNYMSKKYAVSIMSILGFLVCIAAVASIIEDSLRLRVGTCESSKDPD
jgi:hypothetical protein